MFLSNFCDAWIIIPCTLSCWPKKLFCLIQTQNQYIPSQVLIVLNKGISSSWVKIRLHTDNPLPWLTGSSFLCSYVDCWGFVVLSEFESYTSMVLKFKEITYCSSEFCLWFKFNLKFIFSDWKKQTRF